MARISPLNVSAKQFIHPCLARSVVANRGHDHHAEFIGRRIFLEPAGKAPT
jgi:hypothetical protein